MICEDKWQEFSYKENHQQTTQQGSTLSTFDIVQENIFENIQPVIIGVR